MPLSGEAEPFSEMFFEPKRETMGNVQNICLKLEGRILSISVLAPVNLKVAVFWNVTACGLAYRP